MIELIDSHCHLDFPVFDADRSELLDQCRLKGINQFIVPGVESANWPRLLQLREVHPHIHIAFGLHPYFVSSHHINDLQLLTDFCLQHHPVAIGEIGLDFYRKDLPREKQIIFFELQLQIAEKLQLPVILHVRKAHQDVLSLLKQYNLVGGIAHAFNGSMEQAQQYIELGFMFGLGGALTYSNASRLRKLAVDLPLEAIVLETDSPDMRPDNYSDPRNTPLSIRLVLKTLAKLRGASEVELAMQTSENVKKFLALSNPGC